MVTIDFEVDIKIWWYLPFYDTFSDFRSVENTSWYGEAFKKINAISKGLWTHCTVRKKCSVCCFKILMEHRVSAIHRFFYGQESALQCTDPKLWIKHLVTFIWTEKTKWHELWIKPNSSTYLTLQFTYDCCLFKCWSYQQRSHDSLSVYMSQLNWDSQQGRVRTTSILVRAFWNFKRKVLKYPRNCSLHNTLIPWCLKKSWIT